MIVPRRFGVHDRAGGSMPDRSEARKLSRREELGVESRRKIVEAAGALLAERGFAGTSIAAVSRRSGLPSGSIYWHFESKEVLLGAVVEEGARRWFDALPGNDSLPSDPAERATALLEAVVTSLEQHPEFLRLLLVIALERREVDATSLAVIRRVRELALERIRKLLSVLLDSFDRKLADRLAGEFAPFVLCAADGAFVAQHIEPETDLRQTFSLLRRALTALAREIIASTAHEGGR
jgi:AcrR family transcriptional regulator